MNKALIFNFQSKKSLPAGEERARRRRCRVADDSFRKTAAIAVGAPWSPDSKSTWYHLSARVC